MKESITFYVTYHGIRHEIATHETDYRSLMALLYDKFYFEDFGECKGIGRCGTCHVRVSDASPALLARIGNEQTTLSKMENVTELSRLSCQIQVTKAIHNAHFEIVDEGDLGLY